MKKSNSWMFAIISAAVLVIGATPAMAKTTDVCFKTANGKNFIAIDKRGFLNATAKACSGPAVFQVSHVSQRKGQPARVSVPSFIRAANGKYVKFYGRSLRAIASKPRRTKALLHNIRPADRKTRRGQRLRAGQKVTFFPAQARGHLNFAALGGGGKGGKNIRRGRGRPDKQTTFVLTKPGKSKSSVANRGHGKSNTTDVCFRTANGKNFIAINKRGFLNATAKACSGPAVFQVSHISQGKGQPARLSVPSFIRAANGKYVKFYGKKLRAIASKPRRTMALLHNIRPADRKTRRGQRLQAGQKVTFFPAQARGRLNFAALGGGGWGAKNIRRGFGRPDKKTTFVLTKP